MTNPARRRAAALLEVAGVVLAGGLVSSLLVRAFDIPVVNPLADFRADITGPELLTASRRMAVLLLLQYAGLFLLAFPVGWWRRRRGPSAYGLTKAGCSWKTLLAVAVVTAALSEWLVLGITLLNSWFPSPTVPWRQAFFDMSWSRWEFWLFSAVASWVLIPILEELFFRGYCQTRLAEDWGDGPAIVGTACLFTFQHAQYHAPSLYNAGMIAGLLLSAVAFGVAFAWTRSLIPAILAHAVFDIPMTPGWLGLVVLVMLAIAAVTWRRGLAVLRLVCSDRHAGACATLAALGALWAILGSRVGALEYLAAAMLAAAVALEAIDRRARRRAAPALTTT